MAYLFSIRHRSQNDPASFLRPFRPVVDLVTAGGISVPRYTAEFWTARQRAASSIHEVSYRACFKPALVRFFVEHLSHSGDTVYDPFGGRGTTAIEAAILGRSIITNDINPLSKILARPRFFLPELAAVRQRLASLVTDRRSRADIDLSMFYHPDTETEVVSLRKYLARRKAAGREDAIDRWIRMVATNRLTGHSPGFFSVYSLPPNQATSQARQRLINRKLRQKPTYRDTRALIMTKTQQLLKGITREQYMALAAAGQTGRFLTADARHTRGIAPRSVALTVTSPPFLNIVDYAEDNWLRCWFNAIDAEAIARKISTTSSILEWSVVMGGVFRELSRITTPGGWVAFEVGEVRNRTVNLDEIIFPIGMEHSFVCRAIVVNRQSFTKTSNIWGIRNNQGGTNTNRIVLLEKIA